MSDWIDFKELRARLKFEDVLRYYHVQFKAKGDHATGICPLPGHKRREDGKRRTPSLSVHLTRGIFQCFSCGSKGKGNIIDFACLMEGMDPGNGQDIRKTALLLQDQFLNRAPAAKPRDAEPREKSAEAQSSAHEKAGQVATHPAIVNAPLDFELKHLDMKHPYLAERGFTQETIAHFGLGYCAKGLMQERIVIPLRSQTGDLIGYAGRLVDDNAADDESPKYKFPGPRELKGVRYELHKTMFLYNGSEVGENLHDLIVVEGFVSVWWLWQAGIRNAVALMGCDASPEQVKLIVNTVKSDGRIWVLMDGDDAGRRGARKLVLRAARQRFVRWAKLADGVQPTDLSPEELIGLGIPS